MLKFRWVALVLMLAGAPLSAEPTEILIRVISQDAKFIGDSMGGAQILVRDAHSGKQLAKGITAGTTGDTKAIMEAKGRSPRRATPDAASYTARINIKKPTLVEVVVTGSQSSRDSRAQVTSQRWIVPGESFNLGDGWIIELPGLAITPSVTRRANSLQVDTKVELLCGCPITPGGLWDSADYEVRAMLWNGNTLLESAKLNFVEAPGRFAGAIDIPDKGRFRLKLFARNVRTGNSGLVDVKID